MACPGQHLPKPEVLRQKGLAFCARCSKRKQQSNVDRKSNMFDAGARNQKRATRRASRAAGRFCDHGGGKLNILHASDVKVLLACVMRAATQTQCYEPFAQRFTRP
jgi:putative hemolysin